jgi:RING finger protein 113A
MLSRRKEPPKSEANNKAASSSAGGGSSASTSVSSERNILSKGEKRKASSLDPHDEKGSEYLRRKHNFIKSSIRVDYQPDICKDYKETGFCGFGDSCKFLHDRSDYKHGWQLEQEWAKGQYKDEDDDKYLIKDSDEEKDQSTDENQCIICKEPYKDPVVTKCKHYFCGTCADKECIDKCYVCEKPTSGIFKVAKLDSQVKGKS